MASSENGLKRAHYRGTGLAAALISPQLIILLFFFFVPSWKALSLAFVQIDPFGGKAIFVGMQNFIDLFASKTYRYSAWLTFWFTLAQNILTLVIAGALAFATDHVIRGRYGYRTVILLPYAIAPVVSGTIWAFLFNPSVGPIATWLHGMGYPWDPNLRTTDAVILITLASVWKHVCYDYIFLTAAMLAVPQSLREAAAIDGARPWRRFVTVSVPLIMPTVFYLFIMNFVYGLFETFGIIDSVTRGGPAGSTTTLVYKVYQDGFVNLNLGSSAAQSIVLMVLAILFTVLQFRAIERKVNYEV
ncbi:glycerol-3-phosphate transporter permease [Rhizobium sp. LCM 4573]|nr:glycerol-3-phosphate transporter permease [Rhizobium sp. LCM 4573]